MSKADAMSAGGKRRKMLLQLVLGGVTGAVGMFALLTALESQQGLLDDPTRIAALAVALIYLLMAAMVSLGLLMPRFGAQTLNVECAEELREQRTALVIGSVTMLIVAFFLASLALASTPTVPGPLPREVATILAVLSGIALIGVSIRYRKVGDELMQTVSREAHGIMLGLFFLVVGGKSAAAQLGYAAPLGPLAFIAAFFALYLLAAFVAVGRRGLLRPR